MKRLLSIVLTIIMLAALVSGCGQSSAPAAPAESKKAEEKKSEAPASAPAPQKKVFKIGHGNAADYPVSEALAVFAEEVKKLSNGVLEVQVFNDGQLGQEKDCIEGVKLGTMEMARVNSGNMASFVNELNAFTIPFIFRDQDHYWKVLNGPIGESFKKKFEQNGFKLLTFYDEGARYAYHRTKFIMTPADMKSVKIRTMGAASIQDGFKALGASPTPMNFGEVYTALQQGVIDAAENNYASIYTSKQYEPAKFITDTAHLRIPGVLILSMKVWDKMSAQEKEIFQKAADNSRVWEIKRFTDKEEEFLDKCIKGGAQFKKITNEARQEFAKACEPVFEKYKASLGKELIEGIINTK